LPQHQTPDFAPRPTNDNNPLTGDWGASPDVALSSTAPVSEADCLDVTCDVCGDDIDGIFFGCDICDDGEFDICSRCLRGGARCSGAHVVTIQAEGMDGVKSKYAPDVDWLSARDWWAASPADERNGGCDAKSVADDSDGCGGASPKMQNAGWDALPTSQRDRAWGGDTSACSSNSERGDGDRCCGWGSSQAHREAGAWGDGRCSTSDGGWSSQNPPRREHDDRDNVSASRHGGGGWGPAGPATSGHREPQCSDDSVEQRVHQLEQGQSLLTREGFSRLSNEKEGKETAPRVAAQQATCNKVPFTATPDQAGEFNFLRKCLLADSISQDDRYKALGIICHFSSSNSLAAPQLPLRQQGQVTHQKPHELGELFARLNSARRLPKSQQETKVDSHEGVSGCDGGSVDLKQLVKDLSAKLTSVEGRLSNLSSQVQIEAKARASMSDLYDKEFGRVGQDMLTTSMRNEGLLSEMHTGQSSFFKNQSDSVRTDLEHMSTTLRANMNALSAASCEMVAASKLQVESMEGKWNKYVLGHDVEKDMQAKQSELLGVRRIRNEATQELKERVDLTRRELKTIARMDVDLSEVNERLDMGSDADADILERLDGIDARLDQLSEETERTCANRHRDHRGRISNLRRDVDWLRDNGDY